ncbi:MAG TPA: YicC/YloC family endoribonuclease [Burkholderiaceae bacterium]
MAVYSMTGFGNASSAAAAAASVEGSTSADGTALSVELRSVNSRFLDVSFRMPDELRQHEAALRELVAAACRRGKIEVRVSTARGSEGDWPQPTADQLNRLSRLEGAVTAWLPKAQPLSVHEALQWCRSAPAAHGRVDEALLDTGRRAVAALKEARAREGEKLVGILQERIVRLRELAKQAEPLVPAVVERQQQRFLERWNDALKASGGTELPAETLRERALNEAAAFALRIDVAEELSRLRAHLDEIARLLKAGGELGKRLDFLIQELHREANTLGSKSAALELTGVSVEMKVLIEQMREQVQNVE